MSKYLRKFETEAAYTAAESTLALPNVSLITATDRVAYKAGSPTPPVHDYSLDYFTLVAIDNCEFEFTSDGEMSVSTDNGENWESFEYTTAITVSSGDKLLVKSTDGVWEKFLTSSGRYNIEGNIASLGYGDNFIGQTTNNSYFGNLFFGDDNLISAENLVLPATALDNQCYFYMFSNCTNLTTVPKLPATTMEEECYYGMFAGCTSLATVPSNMLSATTLANGCYQFMFYGCTSLTAAPNLPVTELEDGCYNHMFEGCTSLTTAPELPATTLAYNCYAYMFSGCTSLSGITCLATDISAEFCTDEWVDGVAASGTFTKAASMTDWETGIRGIPSGWNVVNA